MNAKTIVNIGEQRFDRIREGNKFYIDKTGLIREWWEYGATVTLIMRPRRFGKTLNMSMVECFFSMQYAGRADLFEGLSIWNEEKYRQLQGTFPVVSFSFANVKTGQAEEMKAAVKQMITDIYAQYRDIMESDIFDENDRGYFKSVHDKMTDDTALVSIQRLCGYLAKYYGRDVIVLLDEYDTPMQEAWLEGSWDEAVQFFRRFFNNTFKTNKHILRGLMTGITRISKESVFSDLNNLDVITTTSHKYATAFGFTEKEVFAALDQSGLGGEKRHVKEWYDGFTFGGYTDIYNPWSIASFIGNNGKYGAYWTNTSENGLVNLLVQRGLPGVKEKMEDLMQGRAITAEIDEQIVFHQLDNDANAVWSLLLATGYLKVVRVDGIECPKAEQVREDGVECPKAPQAQADDACYTLALTNHEVKKMFGKMIKNWFRGSTEVYYNEFINSLLNDNVRRMNTFMNKVALNTFSFFDSGNQPSEKAEPERFYHGFVLGMVVNLADAYKIRSNRESGFGRYDVMLEPFDRNGKAFIFEFKVFDPDEDEVTLEDTVANAHAQIEEKQYEAELVSAGIAAGKIRKYGFAFQGKNCLIG